MSTIPATILIVDDQPSMLALLRHQVRSAGFAVVTASRVQDALSLLRQQPVDIILSDLIMPDLDGLAFLAQVREHFSTIPFVVITSHGSVGSAVEAIKQGAFDYVEKHSSAEELQFTIQKALTYQGLVAQNESLKHELCRKYSFQNIVTTCPVMQQVLEMAATVASAPITTVALFGESGVGKEVLARAIHCSSGGMPANFVGINCAAIPENLLESELFGHARGAFTGAVLDHEGKIAQAKGGTLLLDEIGDMPLDLQPKLLRLLEERVFEKIGCHRPVTVECRIIVATNHNLGKLVKEGRFREDLYHRINVFPLVIPPLRERREDISILADHFITILRRHLGKSLPGVSRNAMTLLLEYPWPGNVRELRNCLERAAIIVPNGNLIRSKHLSIATPLHEEAATSPAATADHTPDEDEFGYRFSFSRDAISLEAITRRVLDLSLEQCGGNKTKAAQLLKVGRNMFYHHSTKDDAPG
jgi:DNA-binding NtrC family response regulator